MTRYRLAEPAAIRSRMSLRPAALILDYGNVLSLPQREDRVVQMAARLQVSPEIFAAAYVAERPAYDAGIPPEEYWRRVSVRLERGARLSSELASLIDDDTASWGDQRVAVWDLARGFRERGGRTAFLSNNVPPLIARLRAEQRIDEVFDVVTSSCELGVAKPDDAIFLHCVRQLGTRPEESLFVDDHPDNITAAARLGFRTLHFVGADAVQKLSEMLV